LVKPTDRQPRDGFRSIREFGFTNPVLIDEQDGIIRMGDFRAKPPAAATST
jgi:ParB-like chromosome segregation protein Spo0J